MQVVEVSIIMVVGDSADYLALEFVVPWSVLYDVSLVLEELSEHEWVFVINVRVCMDELLNLSSSRF